MNWTMLDSIAGILGAIGTVVGLFFVWYELKNVRHGQYAASVQKIVENERELWSMVLENEEMTRLLAEHLDLTGEFLDSLPLKLSYSSALLLLLFFRQYENIYYQNQNDMLHHDLWLHWERSMRHSFGNPTVRSVLYRAKIGYTKDFKKFLTEKIFSRIDPLVVDETNDDDDFQKWYSR